ncbi:flavin reductase family protein [Streptomyces sp. NPDC059398]|uniref:flavin reductase family protein n=1 Tax=Streptomyces sp. NPDC059398 TaxID=3346820 RepID=UPI003685AF7E
MTADGPGQVLREVMGEFVTGVCVASTWAAEGHDAIVVNSLTSVSLDPPLVSVCLREDSTFLRELRSAGVWAVSILPESRHALARALTAPATRRPRPQDAAEWTPGDRTGCLTLADAPGVIECENYRQVALGDHVLVVGRVVGLLRRPVMPLVFHRGSFSLPLA